MNFKSGEREGLKWRGEDGGEEGENKKYKKEGGNIALWKKLKYLPKFLTC